MKFAILPLAVVAACAAGPVLAQEPERVDVVAMVIAGAADGAEVRMAPDVTVTFARTAPGRFEGPAAEIEGDVRFIVQEIAPCVFTLHATAPGEREVTVRFDFNLVSGVVYTPDADTSEYSELLIELVGEGDIVQLEMQDAMLQTVTNRSNLVTSLQQAEMEAAAAALLDLCGL